MSPDPSQASPAKRPAFTLVELLVVIAIVAVVLALVLSAAQHAREAANQATCHNNLRQIGLAVHEYDTDMGYLPSAGNYITMTKAVQHPGELTTYTYWYTDGSGVVLPPSVCWLILPYLEMNDLYTSQGGIRASVVQPVNAYICPSDSSISSGPFYSDFTSNLDDFTNSHYAGSCYVFSQPVFSGIRVNASTSMPDGVSQTIIASERLKTCGSFATYWGTEGGTAGSGGIGCSFTVPGVTTQDSYAAYYPSSEVPTDGKPYSLFEIVPTSVAPIAGPAPSMPIKAGTNQTQCTPAPTA